jgi:CheY-like chemotaxis protein
LYLYRLGQGLPASAYRPRILLVEDDPNTASTMVRLLRKGWDVVHVATVKEALTRVKEPYNWVLLDLILPDGPGSSVLYKIRKDRIRVRVVVISGLSDGPTFQEITDLQPNFLLQKPIDADKLFEILGDKNGSS